MTDSNGGNTEDFHNLDFDEKVEIEKLQATIRSMSNFTDDSEGFLSQSPKALMEGGQVSSSDGEEFDPYAEIEKPYRLEYAGNGIWSGEIRINPAREQRTVEYRYFVKNSKGEIFYEAGKKRAIAINGSTSAIEAFDSWCPNSSLAPFLTAPFSDVLYKNSSSQYTYTHKNNYEIIIRLIAPKTGDRQKVLICGASAELGEWEPSKAKEMTRVEGERWEYSIDGSQAENLEFKFILATAGSAKEVHYEWEDSRSLEKIVSFMLPKLG